MRVKIHVDQDLVKPLHHDKPHITVCTMSGEVLTTCRKVILHGRWVLRQYNNPVPCGASTVLFTEDEHSTYDVVK